MLKFLITFEDGQTTTSTTLTLEKGDDDTVVGVFYDYGAVAYMYIKSISIVKE